MVAVAAHHKDRQELVLAIPLRALSNLELL